MKRKRIDFIQTGPTCSSSSRGSCSCHSSCGRWCCCAWACIRQRRALATSLKVKTTSKMTTQHFRMIMIARIEIALKFGIRDNWDVGLGQLWKQIILIKTAAISFFFSFFFFLFLWAEKAEMDQFYGQSGSRPLRAWGFIGDEEFSYHALLLAVVIDLRL